MSLWVIISLVAACFQTLRFMLQRQLAVNTLSPAGATFARFLYSAPLIAVLLWIYLTVSHQTFPALGGLFWLFAAMGGLAQVLATIALVRVFKARNFSVGVTFAKTEVLLSVAIGLVLLGDAISWFGFAAILLGVWGVVLLSVPPDAPKFRMAHMLTKAARLGIASGALFAISGVTYRGASLQVDMLDPWARAGVTLSAVTAMQLVGMGIWLYLREAGQVAAVWASRRVGIWVGLLSMAGSFCWFTAFTLQNAAYVKAIGQVELILSLLASLLVFREKIALREWGGIGILGGSILLLVLVI